MVVRRERTFRAGLAWPGKSGATRWHFAQNGPAVWLMNTLLAGRVPRISSASRPISAFFASAIWQHRVEAILMLVLVILLGTEVLDERGDPEHHEREDDEANQHHCHHHPARHCRHVHHLELLPEMRFARDLQLSTELR